jgi:hypothetical protein
MNPDALTTLMLLGTNRLKTPPAAPFPVLDGAWAALDWSQPETAALAACALTAAATSAGFTGRRDLALPEPSGPETRPVAPTATGAILRHLLSGEMPECLPEWLECCAAGGWVAAPRDLPALLVKAAQERPLRSLIAAVLGERGAWLARQTGQADLIAPPADPDDSLWETGTLTERLAWFKSTRQADPARAAAALATAWPQESGETRAGFLTVIGNAPHPAELPLLESAIKDRKREVRLLARTALMALPQSTWSQRAFARALPLLKIEGILLTKHLVLHLPEAFDPLWKEDGLEEKVPAGSKGLGPRAWWAIQLLACVPLSLWADHFQMDFARLLTLNKDSASKDVILTGWLESAITGPEPATAEALASHLASLEKWPVSTPSPIPCFLKLLHVLSDETAARLVEAAEAGVLSSIAPGQLFAASTFPGPAAAAPRWFAALLPRLQNPVYSLFQTPTVRQLARRLPFAFIPEALAQLARESTLTSTSETFTRALEFRLQLHQSFTTKQTSDAPG